jgi:cytoskeletal protein CcmA (bactofilin family)
MLYSASGDIIISRMAEYSGSISQTGVSISRMGIVSSLDISVNGTLTTNSLVVNQIFENGNLLGSKYAPLSSPTFTGTVSGITKSMVGLSNVDNTSDANKPVSTAVQTALNLKANTANPTFTGLSTIGSLIIGDDVSMNGKLFVSGDLSLNGKIYANYGDNTIPATAIIGGIPVSTGSFQTDIVGGSRLFITQDASFGGNVYINKTLTVSGPILVSDISASRNIFINGTSRFVGDVSSNRLFVNNLVANSIYSFGDASLNGNLFVSNNIFENGISLSSKYATIETANFTGTSTFEKVHITQDFVNERDTSIYGNLIVLQKITANDISASVITENGQLLTSKYVLATNGTLSSPTITGTVTGITKSMVGLGNVDNTSDVNKPVSTAMQTALNAKANVQDASFIGIPLAPTANAGTTTAQIATTEFVGTAINNLIGPAVGTSFNTLKTIANAINNDLSYSVTVNNALGLKANIASPAFTGTVTAPIIDVSSKLIVRSDSSMNGNLVVGNHVEILGDLSVNGIATINFAQHSIPSTAISFINNEYSTLTINTQRTDVISYDDEFFELSTAGGEQPFIETFYSTNADLSLNGNLRIHGTGLSIIEGDVQLGNRLFLQKDLNINGNTTINGNLTVESTVDFVEDVSMNNNLNINGTIIAQSNMCVFGVISQDNLVVDENGLIVHDNMQNSINSLTTDVELINSQFVVDSVNSVVKIGSTNYPVTINNTLSANGLYTGDASGTLNTTLGFHSNLNGQNNTTVGYNSGSTITSGTNNLILGYNAQPSIGSVTNEITLGNSSISKLRCAVNTITSVSDSRDKKNIEVIPLGLDFITLLKPVKFDWNRRDGVLVDVEEFGFIAQDLQESQNKIGKTVPNLVSDNNPDKLEASYGTLLPIMVKAIQDLNNIVLKQQEEIELLKAKLSA